MVRGVAARPAVPGHQRRRVRATSLAPRLLLVVLAVTTLCCGCNRRPAETKITPSVSSPGVFVVVPFTVDPNAEIDGIEATPEALGRRLAEVIVARLQSAGWSATLDSGDAHPTAPGQYVVAGRMTIINGGSRSLRAHVGLWAGHATFAAQGTVTQPDGAPLSVGSNRQSVGRIGYGGGTNEFVVGLCVDQVAVDITQQIVDARFGRPTSTPPIASPPAPTNVEGRLKQLDDLRARGTITDEEYKAQRKRVLGEL